jgi:hypothetical protein
VKYVCIGESHGNVAVGVCRPVILQRERRPVDFDGPVGREDVGRNGACRRCRKIEVPVFHPLRPRQMIAGIFVRKDRGAFTMQPLITVGVVKVPMRVDQKLDRI